MAECRDGHLDMSQWMSKLSESLLDTPLNEIAIPGTHDSFSYGLDPSSEMGPDVSSVIRTFGAAGKGIVYKWSVTQNQSFREQLDSGIRYFDLRVAFRPSTGKLHFLHGLYGKTVEAELLEIKRFLEEHSKEVVILDFNHFYSMSNGHHSDLMKLIMDVFDQRLCLCVGMESLTLNMLWENGLQVIILYHHKLAEDMCELWPGHHHSRSPWANTPSVPKMIEFLNTSLKRNRDGCFDICQGVLTPDTGFILGHMTGSLKNDIGKKAMPALLDWLKDKKPGCNGVNIVSADFADLSDFARKIVSMNFNQ